MDRAGPGGDKEEADEGGRGGVNAQVEVQRKSSRCPRDQTPTRSHLEVFGALPQRLSA